MTRKSNEMTTARDDIFLFFFKLPRIVDSTRRLLKSLSFFVKTVFKLRYPLLDLLTVHRSRVQSPDITYKYFPQYSVKRILLQ